MQVQRKGAFRMRNRTSVILSGLGIIALLALAPDPAAARGGFGGFHGGGIGGFRGGGFSGVRAGSFGGARAAMVPMGGMRAAAIGRPGWGGAVVRPGWSGAVRPGWGVGWRRGWGGGGWGWGWPVAAGIATGVALAGPWGWGYGSDCTYWNGFAWVNACGYGPYDYGW